MAKYTVVDLVRNEDYELNTLDDIESKLMEVYDDCGAGAEEYFDCFRFLGATPRDKHDLFERLKRRIT